MSTGPSVFASAEGLPLGLSSGLMASFAVQTVMDGWVRLAICTKNVSIENSNDCIEWTARLRSVNLGSSSFARTSIWGEVGADFCLRSVLAPFFAWPAANLSTSSEARWREEFIVIQQLPLRAFSVLPEFRDRLNERRGISEENAMLLRGGDRI